ncbi:class II histone deacetylase complex subunits 2 and 3-domain-containing protein [Tuber indicum]|nr:class II histone deacetylase complex subunits 2 and 3-domain-containing protein [Tuber indicum]
MSENTGRAPPAPSPRPRTVAEIREKLLLNRKATDEKIKLARNYRDALKAPVKAPRSASESLSLGNSPLALGSERAGSFSNNYSSPAMFGSPNLGAEEYLLGLPLGTDSSPNGVVAQRAAYISAITAKSEVIDKFLNHPFPAPEELAGEMDKLAAECRLIAVHPSLSCAETNLRDVDFERESKNYIMTSPKFLFLKKLFDSISELSLKIEIVASPGGTIDMLEIFFRGIKVHCTRRDKLSQLPRLSASEQRGFSKVALLPSSKSGAVPANADLVIAMDSTFVADVPEIVNARKSLFVVGKLAPVLRLVSLNTLEHIELCYKDSEPQYPALYTYIETTKNLLHDTGALVDSYKPTFAAAVPNIAEWLSRNPIAGAPKLEGFPLLPIFERLAQVQSPELHDKRKREGESAEKQSSGQTPPASTIQTKRLRIAGPINSPTPSSSCQQMGTATSAKDPMPIQSTPPTELGAHLPGSAMQVDGDDVGATDTADYGPPKSWVYITEEVVDKMAPADLKKTLTAGKQALQEWKNFALLTQDTVKKQRESFMVLQAEKDGLVKTLSKAEAREKRLDSEVSRLREDLKQANLDIQQAKVDLSSAADPLPIIGQLRDEKEQLRKKLESMDRREKVKETEFEFLREQYQNATSSGVELRKDLDQMKAENALLERRAAATVVELHKAHVSSQLDNYKSQVANLQSKLLEREARLARMEERVSGIPVTRGRALPVDRAATTTPAGSRHPEPVSQNPTRTDRSTNPLP